jgi:hypothetical protein
MEAGTSAIGLAASDAEMLVTVPPVPSMVAKAEPENNRSYQDHVRNHNYDAYDLQDHFNLCTPAPCKIASRSGLTDALLQKVSLA